MEMPKSRTIGALLDELAAEHGARAALVGDGQRYTYAQLRDRVRGIAKDLIAQGVRPGDSVGILMGNRPEWILVCLATTVIGGVMVGINTWSTARELEHLIGHSDTVLLLTEDRFLKYDYLELLNALRPWPERLPKLRRVVVHGAGSIEGGMPYSAFDGSGAHITDAELDAYAAQVTPESVGYLLYTSGSTALPKGVMLQHYGLIENMFGIGSRIGIRAGDRVWLAVSLFWGLGCENALFATMTRAGCVVLQHSYETAEAVRLIEAERCNVIYATPNMMQAMTDHPDAATRDLSSIRTGATYATPERMRQLIATFIPDLVQIYGLTESYGNCVVGDCKDPVDIRATTIGRPLPKTEVRLHDPETGAILPLPATGEVRIRGYVTCCYYKDPERTAEAFDQDGFFLTGDLGTIDANGLFSFRGRLKEMLKTGGINVAPAEVEGVLLTHPGVDQAYVVGLPDAARGEIVAAVIVPHDPAPSVAELEAHCREVLSTFKVPRRFVFVGWDKLPLTVTGKLQKNQLHRLFTTS